MFDLVDGLPVHALVVHAVVVLLPLAALGTLAITLRPPWRLRYGPLVAAAGLATVVLVPVATASGEELEGRVGDPGRHAALGDQLIWFAVPLLVLSTGIVVLELLAARGRRPGGVWFTRVVAGLAVVAALAGCVQVYRVGDSGARAAWAERVASPSTPD